MQDGKEWQRAIPLWRGYIEHASPTNWEGYKPDAIRNLFTAYCRTNQWQAAEKLLLAQQDVFWNVLPKSYAEVAIIAAEQNAIDSANFRYNLGLAFLDVGDYEHALKHAWRAEALGYELHGLRRRLEAAGKWRNPDS